MWVTAALASVMLHPAALAAPPRDIGQALVAARAPLTIDDHGIGGPGAAVLLPAIAEARYIFIGEDHITREIPRFTAAVCDAMAHQGGLAALAMEASPEAGLFVSEALKHPDTESRIDALLARYPDSIAFLNIRQEVDLVRQCAAAAGPGFALWGLDQEFVGAAGWLLDGVAAEHPAEPAASLVAKLQAEASADAGRATASGNGAQLYPFAADRAALARAVAAVEAGGSPRAQSLMRALSATTTIYAEAGAVSNFDRGLLLKRTLAAHLRSLTPPDDRVLLKFGDDHGYKGINPLDQRDLGNFVAELADGQGDRSLHIDVLGARGTHRLYTAYARPTSLVPFVLTDDPDYRWLKPVMDNLVPDGWTLFDLRALRHHSIAGLDPEMQREIYGYDLLLIVPTLTPADLIR